MNHWSRRHFVQDVRAAGLTFSRHVLIQATEVIQ
jgi:hypothetical protein